MTSLPASPASKERSALRVWRETVFDKVIKAMGIAGSIVYVVTMALSYKSTAPTLLIIYTVSYLFVMAAAFLPRVPMVYRTTLFVLMVFSIGVFASLEKAAVGDGRIWLFLSTFLAAAFLGRRAGMVFTILSVLTWGVIGYLFTSSIIPQPEVEQFTFSIWTGTTVTFFMVGITTVLTISALLLNLNQNIEKSDALARSSEEQSNRLKEQSRILERRSEALEASANVNQALAPTLDPEKILSQAAQLIQEQFGLSCVGIFMLDYDTKTINLKANSGGSGYTGSASDYSLFLTEDMIGQSIIQKQALSYHDGDEEVALRLKERQPETRSQAAIPLRGRRETIGALALQSEESQAFGSERLAILQILADQIAMFLENARLLAEREAALEATRRAYGDVTQSAWSEFAISTGQKGVRRDKGGLSPVEAEASLRQEKDGDDFVQSIPIKIRGKIIGYVDAHKSGSRIWTSTEKELLSTLTSRLETAMDSARLYEEAQRRAVRERMVSDVSARMRETLDIEGVLATAAQEFCDSLGMAEAEVWINTDQPHRIEKGDKS